MVVPELSMDLVCAENCFQAACSEECFVLLSASTSSQSWPRNLDVSSAVERLCQPVDPLEGHKMYSNLSILNLFTIITSKFSFQGYQLLPCSHRSAKFRYGTNLALGLHYSAFALRTMLYLCPDISPIQRGIDIWKQLWLAKSTEDEINIDTSLTTENMWRRVGFFQHAPEYWLLAKLSLERMSLCLSAPTSADSSASTMNAETIGLPTKYDESDMSQASALLTGLQNISL
jgi:hypothetical protein